MPPHDHYAERVTLGALLLVAPDEQRAAILEVVAAEDFYDPLHRTVFLALAAAHARGSVDTFVVVGDALRGQCDNPQALLSGLLADVGDTYEGVEAAGIVAKLARCRRALELAVRQQQAASEGDLARVREIAEQLLSIDQERDGFELQSLDIGALLRDGVPETEFLSEPYVPAARRIWVFGPAESAKSMWAMHQAALITRSGRVVMFVSEENPTDEDLRRLVRMGFDLEYLRFYKETGMDLLQPDHTRALITTAESEKAVLVVLDTISAVWRGEEIDNSPVIALDRDVLKPLMDSGVSVLVLDHTGHPQLFVPRKGASAGRGASSKGQKADVVPEFKPTEDRRFSITVGKYRVGNARKPPEMTFEVIDAPGGGLDVVATGESSELAVAELADAAVALIESAPDGCLTTKQLRDALKREMRAGKDRQTAVLDHLKAGRRVYVTEDELIDVGEGTRRTRANVWRPVRDEGGPNALDLE